MEGFDANGFRTFGQPIVRAVVPQDLHEHHVLAFKDRTLMADIRKLNDISPEEFNRRFVAQADENRARGWSND